MTFTPELAAFGAIAGAMCLAAIGVVASKDAVRSALSLVGTFLLLAILYLAMGAEMIGITQIIVYTGAIMVLFLFVVMLLNLGAGNAVREKVDPKTGLGIVTGLALFALVGSQLLPPFLAVTRPAAPADWGGPEVVGRAIFPQFVFPFEAVSILLLVGVVGSILLAKRKL